MARMVNSGTLRPNVSESVVTGADTTAIACADFMAALLRHGFERGEAVRLVAAWLGRPVTDMAATNAVLQNFAETVARHKDS